MFNASLNSGGSTYLVFGRASRPWFRNVQGLGRLAPAVRQRFYQPGIGSSLARVLGSSVAFIEATLKALRSIVL